MIFYLEAAIFCYLFGSLALSFARHTVSPPIAAAGSVLLTTSTVLSIIFAVKVFNLFIMALEKYVGA